MSRSAPSVSADAPAAAARLAELELSDLIGDLPYVTLVTRLHVIELALEGLAAIGEESTIESAPVRALARLVDDLRTTTVAELQKADALLDAIRAGEP